MYLLHVRALVFKIANLQKSIEGLGLVYIG